MSTELSDLEDFFENGELPLRIVDAAGVIVRANRAELDLMAYAAEDYVGRHIAEFHTDRAVADDILARLRRGEKLRRHSARLRAGNGSIREVEITAGARMCDGRMVSARCFTYEVPAARVGSKRRDGLDLDWRAALNAMPVAVYVCDAEGRITYYNEAAVELSGRRPQLGSDSWCVTWRLFTLDGMPLPHHECAMAISLKEGRPIRGIEAIAERPDASRVRFQAFPTPLHDKFGKLIGAINLLVDVEQQRQAEADAARLAAIVLSSDDAIVGKTLSGEVTSWNDAAQQIFGYEANEMVGQPIMRLIPPELHDEEAHILTKLRRGERIGHYETVRLTKSGRRIDVSLSVSPVRDKSGRLIGASKIVRDITQRKRDEATQKLLMGELNHRVKNTLATVQSIANQTLRMARSPSEFVPSFVHRIHALASAHALLTESNWQGAELSALIRTQVCVNNPDESRVSCSGPEVVLEPQLATHLALVLHELATNARKHGSLSSTSGQVSITWSVHSSPLRALHLKWIETGGPPIYVDRQPSTGFGTQLIERCVRIVEGGEAHMRFEAHGVSWNIRLPLPGAAVTLPTKAASCRERAVEVGIDGGGELHNGERILIVEDEAFVAMDMEATLREAGFRTVGPVGIPDEAMRLVARAEVDGVLLDANLGGKPVDELAAALTRRNIPFAFVTGYGRESLPRAFAAAPVLAKPFTAEALVGITRQILSASKEAHPLRRDEPARG